MSFDSALFVWFLVVVVGVHWALLRWPLLRLGWLLSASVLFYGAWDWRYLGLIGFSTLIDWVAGKRIHASRGARARRGWMVASLVANLGLLSVFKYGSFVLASVNGVLEALGAGGRVPVADIVVPVGISFYTFQTLSYTIDIYRGRLEPAKSPLHFALYVVFFPQLVAGPIVRASDLLPQLSVSPPRDPARESAGLFLILLGLVKKVAVADWLAVQVVDRVFDSPSLYSSVEILIAIYAYAVQIYCDFSGYSDVAIGAALVLGYTLCENFARPYTSASLQEFWRRWHISLSSWLRDYLYVPLGGNRRGRLRTYFNLIATMLLGGLWHGASWTFVAWGAWHGLGLALERLVCGSGVLDGASMPVLRRWAGRILVFHFVCLGWVVFRAASFPAARDVLRGLLAGTAHVDNVRPLAAALVLGALAVHVSPGAWRDRLRDRFVAAPAPVQALLAVAACALLQQIKGATVVPFIYFQF